VAPLPPPIADSSLADELEPGANAHRGPRRWALALGGALAATVLGVVVVWALSPQDQVGGEPSLPPETPGEVASAEPPPEAVPALPPDPAAATGGAAGAPGFAKVTSLPFGATVFVDGLPYGDTTPTVLESLPPGPHEVKVSYEGYRDAVTTLEIKPNALVSYQASLERIDGKAVVDEVEPPAEPKKRLSKAEARKARKAELLAARKAEAEAKAEAKAQAREEAKAKAKAEAEVKAQPEPEAEAETASTASRRAERLARSEPARKKTKRGSRDVAAARPGGEGELRVASPPSC